MKPVNLGELLLKAGLLSPYQLQYALSYQEKNGGTLAKAVVSLGFVWDEEITCLLSVYHQVSSINLHHFEVHPMIIKMIPAKTARKLRVLPLSRSETTLTIAMADPSDTLAMDEVKTMTGHDIEPIVASELILEEAISRYYPKQYAFLFVRWPDAEWVASVFEGPYVRCHLHTNACSRDCCDYSKDRETAVSSLSVADAIGIAEDWQRVAVAANLSHGGPPEVIDAVVEPTGEQDRLEAQMKARPWWRELSPGTGSQSGAWFWVPAFPVGKNIGPGFVPPRLVRLHRDGATGSLKVTGPVRSAAFHFRKGRIVCSNDLRDGLGTILVARGRFSREQIEEARAKVGPGNPLAKVLAEYGPVSLAELTDAARENVERILADVLLWGTNTLAFEDHVLPQGVIELVLSPERLLLAAVQRITDQPVRPDWSRWGRSSSRCPRARAPSPRRGTSSRPSSGGSTATAPSRRPRALPAWTSSRPPRSLVRCCCWASCGKRPWPRIRRRRQEPSPRSSRTNVAHRRPDVQAEPAADHAADQASDTR